MKKSGSPQPDLYYVISDTWTFAHRNRDVDCESGCGCPGIYLVVGVRRSSRAVGCDLTRTIIYFTSPAAAVGFVESENE